MYNARASMTMIRSFRQDPSITHQKLKKGTVRRILTYARPYRGALIAFMVTTALDALITVVSPLLLRAIIDRGILPRNQAIVIAIAGALAAVALFDAFLGVANRWFSSRIGESLIYDLRTQVFRHVQRQPVAFFTRAQTGSLVSRLNSDVIGAQQAITSTMSSVLSSALSLVAILITMFYLSWLVSVIALALIPLFILPARRVGRRMQRLTRESMQLDAQMGSTMTERFNVAGAMLVKLFGRPREEEEVFADRAARVRDIGVSTAMYGLGVLHLADPAGRAGHRRGLRAGRQPDHPRRLPARHAGRADRAAEPGLRADHLAVQRPGHRDDRAGQLRPGVRGAGPQAADRGQARCGGAAAYGRRHRTVPTVRPRTSNSAT